MADAMTPHRLTINEQFYARNRSRREKVKEGLLEKSEVFNKILVAVVVVLAIMLVAQLIFHFVLVPNLRIERVEVESDLALTKDEILRAAGLNREILFFLLNEDLVRNNLLSQPVVKNVVVEKQFPDVVKLRIEKRKALAIALAEVEGRSVPVVFDDEGVVFQIGKEVSNWDLPVISGLQFPAVYPGLKLPGQLSLLWEDLKKLRSDSPLLYNQISEVQIMKKEYVDFECALFLSKFKTKVLINPGITENLMKYILMTLEVVDKHRGSRDIKEIDFRPPEVVISFVEG